MRTESRASQTSAGVPVHAPRSPRPVEATRDVVIARSITAPRQLLFRAFTAPEQLAAWWGPHGFTTPSCSVDARPGGAYRIVMRGPDGVAYPMKGVYREIVEPERLAFTVDVTEHPEEWHNLLRAKLGRKPNAAALKDSLTTVTFEARPGGTALTIRTRFESPAVRDAMLEMGMTEGWAQSLDRLEEELESAGDREISAGRVIDADPDRVFRMWTEPEHVARWWGPNGFATTIQAMEVRPGGTWQFVMHGPDGVDYKNKIVYREVLRPERLVYDHVSGPQFHVIVAFAADGRKTRVAMRMLFETPSLRNKVAEEYRAVEGLAQTMDRLVRYVEGS